MRDSNAAVLLKLVWMHKNISRAELARQTGLSRSAVSTIIEDLRSRGLVSFRGEGTSSGGRRPVMIGLDAEAFVIGGYDFGTDRLSVVLTDLNGTVLAWRSTPFGVYGDPRGTIAHARLFLEQCLEEANRSWCELVGIGVAVPSPVDPRDGQSVSTRVMPCWEGIRVRDEVRQHFDVPVLVANDANLGALAELWWGAGRQLGDVAFVVLGRGVGCGHLVGGRIHGGYTGEAGEIGHLQVDPKGPLCVCGRQGCLESLVGAPALLEKVRIGIRKTPTSALARREITIDALITAALEGDELAARIIAETVAYLADSLCCNLVNFYNPAAIVFWGELTRLGDQLLGPMRQRLSQRKLWNASAETLVTAAELGDRTLAMGAATLVLQESLRDLRLFPQTRQTTKLARS